MMKLKRINELKSVKQMIIPAIIILTISSCKYESEFEYIISKEDSIKRVLHTSPSGIVIMEPKMNFLRYNFILDSNDKSYFHSFAEVDTTVKFVDIEEPEFINLQPNSVFKIPKGLEKEFFIENVLNQKTSAKMRGINFISVKDTIKSDFLKYLIEIHRKDSVGILLSIRLALPEERDVLRHKIEGKYYKLPNPN